MFEVVCASDAVFSWRQGWEQDCFPTVCPLRWLGRAWPNLADGSRTSLPGLFSRVRVQSMRTRPCRGCVAGENTVLICVTWLKCTVSSGFMNTLFMCMHLDLTVVARCINSHQFESLTLFLAEIHTFMVPALNQ